MSIRLLMIFSLFAFGCVKEGKLGSKDNPIKLYFTPSVDSETIVTGSNEFVKFLEKETNLYFKTGVPTSYIAVVEAFGSNRADIAVMNSFGYLMANKKYGARAKLRVIRYGEDSYRGQIITRTDSGIDDIKDLNNKKFAFTDSSSTSGYMFPLKILKENNIDLKSHVFAMKHDNVVTMVYQGQVDAGATYWSPPSDKGEIRDARIRVKTQFSDVEKRVKILKLTEKIPNDPFVFRKDLPEEIVTNFISVMKKFIATKEGKETFRTIYGVDGVVDAKDDDWNGLRDMIKTINLDMGALVK